MHLIMFDIDGTLTETVKIDDECYVRTAAEVYGYTDINTDWTHYPHATDSCIAHEIYQARTGRPPTKDDISRFRRRFVELIGAASSRAPFTSVAGAGRMLCRLAACGTYRVALATGGWSDSARIKLASAGMCFDDYPAASADDALDRETIMRLSMERAAQRHGAPFVSALYVGDGVWDARACRAMGIPFIGIGTGAQAAKLAAEGAVRVFENYSDEGLFLASLKELTLGAGTANRRSG